MAERRRVGNGDDTRERGGAGKALKRRGILAAAGAVVAGMVAKQASQPVAALNGDLVVLGSVGNAATMETGVLNSGPASPGGPAIHGFRSPGASTLVATTLNAGVVGQTFVTDAPGVFGSSPNGSQAKGVYGTSGGGYGVYGQSVSGNGAFAQSNSGVGVFGASNTSYGVLGASSGAHGVTGVTSGAGFAGLIGQAGANGTTGLVGVVAPGTSGAFAAQFSGPVLVQGSLAVSGAKSAAARHTDGTRRLLYCVEAPESWFEDFGEGRLVDGKAEVALDPGFAGVVDTSELHVFLTEHGDHHLHVSRRTGGGFTVEADSALAKLKGKQVGDLTGTFSYRVVARRGDIKAERLAQYEMPTIEGITLPPTPPTPPQPPRKP